jgi:hypothetical protein
MGPCQHARCSAPLGGDNPGVIVPYEMSIRRTWLRIVWSGWVDRSKDASARITLEQRINKACTRTDGGKLPQIRICRSHLPPEYQPGKYTGRKKGCEEGAVPMRWADEQARKRTAEQAALDERHQDAARATRSKVYTTPEEPETEDHMRETIQQLREQIKQLTETSKEEAEKHSVDVDAWRKKYETLHNQLLTNVENRQVCKWMMCSVCICGFAFFCCFCIFIRVYMVCFCVYAAAIENHLPREASVCAVYGTARALSVRVSYGSISTSIPAVHVHAHI